jgi:hypothetical protein
MATRFTSPFPRFFTDSSALLSGGKLTFYEAETTTLKDTYSDNGLTTPNVNPVILSASGVIPDIFLDGSYYVTLKNSDGVLVDAADYVNAGSDEFVAWSGWDSGVDYESGPSIIVTGSNGKYYKSLQTPNLANDPTSSPAFWGRVYLISDTDPKQGGPLDSNSHQIQWSKGADVASAAALPVLTDGNYFDVTGTTAITSINTTKIGNIIKLHFDGVLTLTHHATDLVLPGGANITTAAGDEAEFIEYATGDYRCVNYSKADGNPVIISSGLILLSTADASNDSSIDFTGIDDTYDEYELRILNAIPATDNTTAQLLYSNDNGSTFEATGYDWNLGSIVGAGITVSNTVNDTVIELTPGDVGSTANETGFSAVIRIIRPSDATYTQVNWRGGYTISPSSYPRAVYGAAQRDVAEAVDAIRFNFAAGNVESGKFALYGVNR